MKFFVIGKFVEPGPLFPMDQVVGMVENVIIPSVEMLESWEQQGKITGGAIAGTRTAVLIVEADSSEDLGQMLPSLPGWGVLDWEVHPLQSTTSVKSRETRVVEQLKQFLSNT